MTDLPQELQKLVDEAKAEAKAEEKQHKQYIDAMKKAREIHGNARDLEYHEDFEVRENPRIQAEVEKLHQDVADTLADLPEEDREKAQLRLDFDDVMRRLNYHIEMVSSGNWKGNPWRALTLSVEDALEIGFIRLAEPEELNEKGRVKKGRYIMAYVDGKLRVFVPTDPDSTMTKALFGRAVRDDNNNVVMEARDNNGNVVETGGLLGLRAFCQVASNDHKALQEHRERRMEVLQTSFEDVEAVMNGEDAEVAGMLPWRVGNHTREVYLEVKAEDGNVHVVDADDALGLAGKTTDLSNGRLFAALGQLKKALESQGGTQAPEEHRVELPPEAKKALEEMSAKNRKVLGLDDEDAEADEAAESEE
ncbi:MAG: hypothetical protein R3346_01425 [Candidatus Spechtbacterales bacterium]|nr:hypothetical protein [Candidatus Spechtbacterales bacterium]